MFRITYMLNQSKDISDFFSEMRADTSGVPLKNPDPMSCSVRSRSFADRKKPDIKVTD